MKIGQGLSSDNLFILKMDKLKLSLIISTGLLIIACVHIVTEEINLCELAKNESYDVGFNNGVEQWNSAVIYEVNKNRVIPYWYNQSYYELNIAQLCG